VCGAIGLAMSAVSAAVSCGDAAFGGGSWGECAVGAAGVLVGGAGMVAARSLSAVAKVGGTRFGDVNVVNVVNGNVSGAVVQVGVVGRVVGNVNIVNVVNGNVSGAVTQIGVVGRVYGNLSVSNSVIGNVSGTVAQIGKVSGTVRFSSPAGNVTLSPMGGMTITP
jgi:hypothetical protein